MLDVESCKLEGFEVRVSWLHNQVVTPYARGTEQPPTRLPREALVAVGCPWSLLGGSFGPHDTLLVLLLPSLLLHLSTLRWKKAALCGQPAQGRGGALGHSPGLVDQLRVHLPSRR